MLQKGFHIINASAGSGKTFTLVFHYLQQLLASPNKDSYQHLLAMTFTNKAVTEMKERILEVLADLAAGKNHTMKKGLCDNLSLSEEEIQWRAAQKLEAILHNFGAFDVTTLDSFTHRVIRTFAFDLGLSHSFEVVIDSATFIRDIVDQLIDKVGVSKGLTQLLTQFSLQKIQEEKSWDISHDINSFTPLLLNENDRLPLQALQETSLEQFQQDHKVIRAQMQAISSAVSQEAELLLERLNQADFRNEDFPNGLLIKHFTRIKGLSNENNATIKSWFKNKLGQQLSEGTGFFKKGIDNDKKAVLEDLAPQFSKVYQQTKEKIIHYIFLKTLQQQWVPLSLLGMLGKTLEEEQKTQNKMLLGRFNERIAAIVREQPVPFIYERLGTRYQHYFIDEFQDTSVLQWQNLIPLVANAIESNPENSLLLVGDPKQAIYRWRGGHVQQFLDLMQGKSDFSVPAEQHRLGTNYRSCDAVVGFNNHFFPFAASVLQDPQQKELFSSSLIQEKNEKAGGVVAIHRIENARTVAERGVLYSQKIVSLATTLKEQGYAWNAIVILVRKKNQAQLLVEALQEQSIPAISSDSLLLASAPQIQALVAILRLSCYPKDRVAMKVILDWVWETHEKESDYHNFVNQYLQADLETFFKQLNGLYEIEFDSKKLREYALYEVIEYCLECLNFLFEDDVYLLRFLEVAFHYSQQQSTHPKDFIKYWEREKEQLTIQFPEDTQTIQVMTVHKSKGLEFEVVLYPFLEDSFGPSPKDKLWYSLAEEKELDSAWARFNYSESIADFGGEGEKVVARENRSTALDSLNLLYVGCTRAISQLHLISREVTKKPSKPTYDYLLQEFIAEQLESERIPESFYWSREVLPLSKKTEKKAVVQYASSSNSEWRKRLLVKRHTDQAARDFGILIHDLLGRIKDSSQLQIVLAEAQREGRFQAEEYSKIEELLQEVINHPQLLTAFDSESKMWIERDIMLPNGKSIRPDRVVLTNDQAVLIDFKTGSPQKKDETQIRSYADTIAHMGYLVVSKLLVYIGTTLEVKSV